MSTILAVVFLLLAGFLAYVAMQPTDFRIERTARVARPPEQVFPHVDDLRRWAAWSPWDKFDPAMKKTYGGAEHGTGATYHWVGNNKVGEGRMTIASSTPSSEIRIDLAFEKPMAARNLTTFRFTPVEGGTQVAWIMEGQRNFMMKLFGIVMNMDRMLSQQFDEGLAALAKAAESSS